ncbi:hypothetical protein [Polaribacter uvawellassae]|uniref:hypothetical protein n=1 Tax=Polaribacter uvawellassae TaxID=3133495 RepID=UPI00321B6736
MKKLLFIIFTTFSVISYAQENTINLVENTLKYLKIKKENCFTKFIKNKKITESESIILIPEIAEKGNGYIILNGHILIVNNKSGKIKSRFSEKESWFSDAVRLNNIQIIYKPYKISKDSETIGIVIDYYGNSRANPFSSKELSLFIRKEEKLIRVLKDYPIYSLNGETNGMNSGEFVEHKKTIEPIINSQTKFFNLKVIDSIIKTESKNGVQTKIKKSNKVEQLKFINGKYKNVL